MNQARLRRLKAHRLTLASGLAILQNTDPAYGNYTETIKGIEERIARITAEIDAEENQ